MSLPNLLSVGLAWGQMVALMPMLAVVDQPELEIMNEDIPEYEGPVALLGESLALALVAIGAVKMVFWHNEESEERKRKRKRGLLLLPQQDAHFYYQLAEVLDRQQCVLQFVCWLALNEHRNHNLTREQEMFIGPFRKHPPRSIYLDRSPALMHLDRAYQLGQKSNSSQSPCRDTYSRCRSSMGTMTRILLWIQDIQDNGLRTIRKFFQKPKRVFRSRSRTRDKDTDKALPSENLIYKLRLKR